MRNNLMAFVLSFIVSVLTLQLDIKDTSRYIESSINSTVQIRPVPSIMNGGTGVIIKSIKYDCDNYNFIITCDHVTRTYKSAYFMHNSYDEMHDIKKRTVLYAEILKTDPKCDLAVLLNISDVSLAEFTSSVISVDDHKKLRLGQQVYSVGCPMLDDPLVNIGNIAAFNRGGEISISAPAIGGNSGGGIFYQNKLIGLVSNIRSTSAFSPSTVTIPYPNLSYGPNLDKIRKFLIDNELGFLIDEQDGSSLDKIKEKKPKFDPEVIIPKEIK